MPRKSRKKCLTSCKYRTNYAKKKRLRENSLSVLPTALPNETSCPLASRSNSIVQEGGLQSKNNEDVIASFHENLERDCASTSIFNKSKDLEESLKSKNNENIIVSLQENLEGDGASSVQVPTENNLSSPSTTPPISPVTIVTPYFNQVGADCLISPSTGVLRDRGNILFDFDEEAVVNSPPIKRYPCSPESQESPANGQKSTSFFSVDGAKEQCLEPSSITKPSEDFLNSQLTVDKSANKVFTVASICIVDPSPSEIFPRLPKERNPKPGPSPSEHTSCSKQHCPFEFAESLVRSQLPTNWQVSTNSAGTYLRLSMLSSEDLCSAIQRTVLISKDGTVQMSVHCHTLGLDHQIWQDLPHRVPLTTQESVTEFVQYVMEVVNIIRSYMVCIGIPESKYSTLTAKHTGLVLDWNPFRESRYTVTYRSVNCEMLLPTKVRILKFCSHCYTIRETVLKRYRRAEDHMKSPHPKTNYRYLDSPQKKHKLTTHCQHT